MDNFTPHYNELKRQGFKLIRSNIGNMDFEHPCNKKYTICFNWCTLIVYHQSLAVYETTTINEQLIIQLIQYIKDFKLNRKRFIESITIS